MLRIEYSKQAAKFLRNCPESDRIEKKIRRLSSHPIISDSKRVLGVKDKMFRIRVGSYRVIYWVIYEENLIIVVKIDSRANVYTNLFK